MSPLTRLLQRVSFYASPSTRLSLRFSLCKRGTGKEPRAGPRAGPQAGPQAEGGAEGGKGRSKGGSLDRKVGRWGWEVGLDEQCLVDLQGYIKAEL